MSTPQPSNGTELPSGLEVVPEVVGEKLQILNTTREHVGIPLEEVQSPPLSHKEMTASFWETHDQGNEEDIRKLAEFTLRFDIV